MYVWTNQAFAFECVPNGKEKRIYFPQNKFNIMIAYDWAIKLARGKLMEVRPFEKLYNYTTWHMLPNDVIRSSSNKQKQKITITCTFIVFINSTQHIIYYITPSVYAHRRVHISIMFWSGAFHTYSYSVKEGWERLSREWMRFWGEWGSGLYC